ncbi:cathelicidin-related antimicrobial peptide Bf-CRAMP-like [Dromiciops gliroides]|uniref:cathelicidin-related antimicrobial peptide Bf-CRAMP-like n=1 Tax=Dromiciops gliroides TaxID=33562 RepID=UPI001CC3A4B9|nr:cathelicidin-related antimicrobial peptide Bf-CRAMP-like [Dromiciops gliroides]
MEHIRKVLLLASVATLIPTQALPLSGLSYQKALSTAIHFYNKVHNEENAFRLFQTYTPSPDQGPQEETLNRLSFTLKETVCPVTEELLVDQCDFKDDGLVKECQGSVSNEENIAAIILTCDPEALGSSRSRRAPIPRRKKGSKKNNHKTGGYSLIALGSTNIHKAPYMESL